MGHTAEVAIREKYSKKRQWCADFSLRNETLTTI